MTPEGEAFKLTFSQLYLKRCSTDKGVEVHAPVVAFAAAALLLTRL